MSVQVSYKKQFLFSIILFFIFLLIIEISIRIMEYNEPDCDFLMKDALDELDLNMKKTICYDEINTPYERPDIMRPLPNYHSSTININSFGFRGPEITLEKPVNTIRIFVVGGSTVGGDGSVSDATTLPGFLQKLFDSTNLNVEVINAGIATSYSLSEEWYVKNYLLQFDPDIIIIYNGGNDSRYRYSDSEIIEQSELKKLSFRTFYNFRTLNLILTTFHPDLTEQAIKSFHPKIDHNSTQTAILWKTRMASICEYGNEHNFKTIIAVQSILASTNKTYSPDEQKAFDSQFHSNGDLTWVSLEKMANFLPELDKSCAKTIDLRKQFDNYTRPIFFDDIHINDFGNSIVARNLFNATFSFIQ